MFGVSSTAWQLRKNARDLRLLERGQPAFGRRIDKSVVTHRNGRDWRLTFEYPTPRGLQRTTVTLPERDAGRLVDQEREPLLFDPDAPERALVLDELPDGLRVVDGGLTPVPAWRVALRCVAPVLAAAALTASLLRTGLVY